MNNDTVGDPPVPIELLLLGFFRYVGHSFTMDNLEEATAAVSAETHRQFKLFFLSCKKKISSLLSSIYFNSK